MPLSAKSLLFFLKKALFRYAQTFVLMK